MRAFIAIDLPAEIGTEIGRMQASFRHQLSSEGLGDAGLRWAGPGGIHLTLKFLGEITEDQLSRTAGLLRSLDAFEKFTVQIRGYGFFPDRRRPQVFWAGITPQPALNRLASCVSQATARAGFAAEKRTFRPHLTLARFRVPRRLPALELACEQQSGQPLGEFEVSEFFLFESRLSSGAPAQYRKIARFPDLV